MLLALGVALGRYAVVTLRLDSPVPIPGGVGGRATTALWRAVDRVVVSTEEDRQLLLVVRELAPEQIVLDAPEALEKEATGPRWPSATERTLRELVQDEIRSAAAAERAARAARRELGAPSPEVASALASPGATRPTLSGFAQAALSLSRRRALALWRRQRALAAGSRST